MDYVVGSIAALISGNVTPNRPKLIRRALTPTKHPASPNVTPKSEAVDDRSVFLSPSVQKKKAIVKKSPKRIFENPDLDASETAETTSPKADKVKKHLVEELESGVMGKSSILGKKSPSNKLDESFAPPSPNKKSKINDARVSNENTPKKNKRKSQLVTQNEENTSTITEDITSPTTTTPNNVEKEKVASQAANNNQTPKKNKRKSKSEPEDPKTEEMEVVQSPQKNKSPKKKLILEPSNVDNKENHAEPTEANKANQKATNTNEPGSKKKNKKRKKKAKAVNQAESGNTVKEDNVKEATVVPSESKNQKKKKNRKNKNKKPKLESTEQKPDKLDDKTMESDDDDNKTNKKVDTQDKVTTKEVDGNESDDEEDSDSEEVSNIPNPNAITEMDSDSEHDSDDEIESDVETSNAEALQTENADDTSDDDDELPKKGKKGKEVTKKDKETTEADKKEVTEVNTEEEIKRTLFVGNVPFSNKCKKELKKIFAQYGNIETVRIRTVPVKDARVTPKLAVIRNELHPDRSTVNVYIKFTDADSVERALCENNRVLNKHHLRVSRSAATGAEHAAERAVFVGNLPFGIEDETLRARFEACGRIVSVRVVRDRKTNAGKGFGYVNFESADGVELALGLSEEDLTVKNRIMRVKRCTQTHNKGLKKGNQSGKPPRTESQNRNFGNNQGQNRNFGNNQGQNRNFGNNQGQNRNFGNNQGQNSNFGRNNQGPRSFGNNQPQRSFGNNQGPNRNFGNNQGRDSGNYQGRNFGNNQGRNFGNNQGRSFGNQGNEASGASRRIMNKRPHQESSDGPPNKRQNVNQPPREKKQRKEFVGITAEKKKKQKFDKGQKKKKALSEIMTKKS